MSRPIEFRVWDSKEKLMAWPKEYPRDLHELCSGYLLTDRERFIFLQYTGLLDKNGNKIFEGDILRYFSKSLLDEGPLQERKHSITWNQHELCWWVGSNNGFQPNMQIDNNNFEIIGNIFESPEILTTME